MMYNVHMKKYKVWMVRERLSEALDYARAGEPVFIERKGVTYRLSVEPATKKKAPAKARLEVLDPALTAGDWSWDWSGGELKFRARR
jgi:antitoxin (DNA-binding transcriptional repressor) of toxin-antitoxin stability system